MKTTLTTYTLTLVLLAFLAALPVGAHQGAQPRSWQEPGQPLEKIPQLVLAATDVKAELALDAAVKSPAPLRYAVAQRLESSPASHGTWEQVPGGRLWRLRVVSTGATDLNFGFTTYWLPEGAMLYVISESQNYYQGPYTSEHNAEHGQLWTAVVPGEAAVIELFVPTKSKEEPRLILGQVGTGYRDTFHLKDDPSFSKAGACEIDVVCPQGAPWTNEIRSVARISIGGTGLCTATMLMNAAGDFRPFLLTANHCGINAGNASTVVAYWNYQSPTCGTHGMGGSLAQNTSGAIFRAAKTDVDFCLIELQSTPDSSYAVYYAGWDRSGTAPASGVAIHHPNGDGKCISFSPSPFTTVAGCITGTGVPNTHWRVNWGTQGVTEPGSSGSGIWDAATRRVVGDLSGGPSYCGAGPADLNDCYGKVSVAWSSGASAAARLREWLDPSNTGITGMNGAYPVIVLPPNDTCAGAIPLVMGGSYSMSTANATSAGDPVPTCPASFGKGVWFRYTSLASGTVTIETCASGFDTVLAVYAGNCGSLTEIACNDDYCGSLGLQSQVAFSATAGTTYYILAGGYGSASGNLIIKTSLLNDQCPGAVRLSPGLPVSVDTTTATSTGDPLPTCGSGGTNGVWFTFVPTVNEQVVVKTRGSSFDTVLAVYTGTCASRTQIGCNDDDPSGGLSSLVSFAGTAGTTYYILAAGFFGERGALQIAAEVSNDKCSNPIALVAGTPYTMLTADASSFEDPMPICSGAPADGVWFTFTPASSGVVSISACGSGFDTVLQAFSGSCGSLTAVGCNDDTYNCGSLGSFLQFSGTAGTNYYILAGGYDGASGSLSLTANVGAPRVLSVASTPISGITIAGSHQDISGQFGGTPPFTRTYADGLVVWMQAPTPVGTYRFDKWQLDGADYATTPLVSVTMNAAHTLTAVYVPVNDLCGDAIALAAGIATNLSTVGATTNTDPQLSCGNQFGNGVWFTFTPGSTGPVVISTCGSDFDTVLGVYSGNCGSLVPIICNDDGGQCPTSGLASFAAFSGTAGTTYHILAGGFQGDTGNLSIMAEQRPPTTLAVSSYPMTGVSVSAFPNDVAGQFGGPTPFVSTYALNTRVSLSAPAAPGSYVFQKWVLDGVDFSTSSSAWVTNNVNHTAVAVYVPRNDLCANAVPLVIGTPLTMSTQGATTTGDAPSSCGPTNSVWFAVVPPANGVVTVNTCGSGFDTVVQVYSGTCGALVPVACNDDGYQCVQANSLASFAQFNATAGTTYYIQAGGFLGATGNLTILASLTSPVSLRVNSSPRYGVLIPAGPADLSGAYGDYTPFIRSYAAGSLVLFEAPASDGMNTFVKWQLDGVDLTTARQAFVTNDAAHTLTAIYTVANDVCAGAIALTNLQPYAMNTAAATDAGEPPVPCAPLHKGVWFTYTPAANELVTVSTCGSSFDTVLQVFTGGCGGLQRVPYGCKDDSGPACSGVQSSVVFSGAMGVTYYIVAGSFGAASGDLQITATSALVNDDCAGALPLSYGAPFSMLTTSASTVPSEQGLPCQPNSGKGVWFTFRAPFTGPVSVSTCGSSFDTVLAVYSGNCGSLNIVACNDDNGSSCAGLRASLSFPATNSTLYHILVAGYDEQVGQLTITVGVPPVITTGTAQSWVTLQWPVYYWPAFVLQQKDGTVESPAAWRDMLPLNGLPVYIAPTNPAALFRLTTP